jgi:hypothetical protein
MPNRTAASEPARYRDQHLDALDEAVRAIARDARRLLGQEREVEAQIDLLSRSILNAARVVEQARRHRDD